STFVSCLRKMRTPYHNSCSVNRKKSAGRRRRVAPRTCSHPGSSDKSRWSSAFSRASTSANLQPRAVVSPVDCLWSWKVKEETNGEPQHHRRCQSFGHDLPFWSRKNACSEFQRGTKDKSPTHGAKDHCAGERKRSLETFALCCLATDHGKPEADVPWTAEREK